MPTLNFSVDAALLRELGERLVGKPYIALAELIKNSYDADANNVIIRFDRDSIEVADDGNGMTLDEFRRFWMRIGTPHKQQEALSRKYKRRLTGSKGIGRLAVQFLARRVDIATRSAGDSDKELAAAVDWDTAVTAGELTHATALYKEIAPSSPLPTSSRHGTVITLRGLHDAWLPGAVGEIAEEVWALEPPFSPNPQLPQEAAAAFSVEIRSPDGSAVAAFQNKMRAYLDVWYARIRGKVSESGPSTTINLEVVFSDGHRETVPYSVPGLLLHALEFEIRVYYLANRLGRGVKVSAAREYLNEFGGVHIYDGGFHLPYYGPDTDWLNVERDHAKRLSISKLLPREFQVERGLNFLPTQSRLFGVVHVDTAFEREAAKRERRAEREALTIQVTRDRLVDNQAFEKLGEAVRWSLDYYAMVEARRAVATAAAQAERRPELLGATFGSVLRRYESEIPKPVFSKLRRELQELERVEAAERDLVIRRTGLLSALATAGIASLAFDHELSKQLNLLSDFVARINAMLRSGRPTVKELENLGASLEAWIERARATRSLFSHLADEENRAVEDRFSTPVVIREVVRQLGSLLRGIEVDTEKMDGSVLLPRATFSEWSAVFQNLLINAVNAMMDSKVRRIALSTRSSGRSRSILIQDTGTGVDLPTADRLFEPFERGSQITSERRALGLGGLGLGLTIVKTIGQNRGFAVTFVEPHAPFKTALRLEWRAS